MRQLRVQHPAAVLLTDACLTLDTHLGDGTTSVCLLAAELMFVIDELTNSYQKKWI